MPGGRYGGAWISAGPRQADVREAAADLNNLVARLAGRGLGIPDPDRTRRYLQHIGYYRLSPYTIPFQQGGPEHAFREGAVFDDVLDLYVFDRALRLLVMDAMERVEVAVRAALTDHMSTTYMDSHWYEAPRTSETAESTTASSRWSGTPATVSCAGRRTLGGTR